MNMNLKTSTLAALCFLAIGARAQKSYFVDGFHGGVYGHYPLATYTRYMVDQLRQYPSWRIGLEIEPETWDSVRVRTPEAYVDFRNLTGGRQMEYTNPTYAQPYLYNIEGESIIRQFVYGMRKVRSHFPDMLMATYSCEEPCFTSCLPQVLSQLGFRYASLKCPDTCWGGYSAPHGGELVRFIGPDGTAMLAVPRYACEELVETSVWQTTAWNNSPRYLAACRDYGIKHPVGMCYQDAGWTRGPWLGPKPESEYVRWTDYIDTVADRASATDYHFSQEDVRPGLMWGSQVLSTLARQVRHAETSVVAAEAIAAMHHTLEGKAYPSAEFDEAWRQLMLAQHHDSWIVPYNHLNARGTWADNIALWTAVTDSISRSVIGRMAGGTAFVGHEPAAAPAIVATEPATLRVYNTAATPRQEVAAYRLPSSLTAGAIRLTAPDGSEAEYAVADGVLYFRATVPAFGFSTYRIEKGHGRQAKPTRGIKTGGGRCVVENSAVRLVFDLRHGGVVTSMRTLADKREHAFRAQPATPGAPSVAMGELCGYFADEQRFRSSAESEAEVEVVADNSLMKRVRIKGHIASVPFTQTVTLTDGSPLIDIDVDIDWKENVHIGDLRQRDKGDKSVAYYDTQYMLSYMLPTGMAGAALYKDAPFDVCRSALDDTFYNRWDSIKHNVVLNWIDVTAADKAKSGRSLALLSDRTTSYSFDKSGLLRLTLQYSGPGLWARDHTITAPLHQHFALMPHRGLWSEVGIADESARWNTPLVAVGTSAAASVAATPAARESLSDEQASIITLPKGSGYQLSSATVDTDGSLIVRLFNASGDDRPVTASLGIGTDGIEEVDLTGRAIAAVPVVGRAGGATFTVSMPRFAIKTLKIKGRR